MSKQALVDGPLTTYISGNEAIEGFYFTIDDKVWPTKTIVYKSYSGEITAFGHGYLNKNSSSKVLLQRVPENVHITVGN